MLRARYNYRPSAIPRWCRRDIPRTYAPRQFFPEDNERNPPRADVPLPSPVKKDTTLKRCFGVEGKVVDYDFEYLKTLRTLRPPHVPMPSLKQVLEFMCQPAGADMWLLLDIKGDNDPEIIRLTAEVVRAVNPKREFWRDRVVLGCWTLEFLAVILPLKCPRLLFSSFRLLTEG